MKIIYEEEGVINSLVTLPYRVLRASPFSKYLDLYFSKRRFNFKYTDLKLWWYSLLKWVPELEHQIGRLINMEKIFKCISETKINGDIIEFGSYKGLSIIWMARFREKYNLQSKKIIAVDSFEGLPVDSTIWSKGQMSDTSVNELKKNLEKYLTPKQRENIFVVKGLFSSKNVQKQIDKLIETGICLSHIDCDLGSSCSDALGLIFRYLNKNRSLFILFDDWGCHPDEIPLSWNNFKRKLKNFMSIEVSSTNLTRYLYVHKIPT